MKPSTTAIALLAAARVTRLFTHDDFPPIVATRRYLNDRFGRDHWSATLVGTVETTVEVEDRDGPVTLSATPGCPWCMGFWISAAAVYSAARWGEKPLWRALAAPWAASMVVSPIVVGTASID